MARTTTWPSVRACGACGRVRKIQRAAVDGDPDMCQACWARDRRSWIVCSRCGELRRNQGRDRETGEPICQRCYRHARPTGECDSCGQTKQLARTGGRGGPALCGACVQRERRPRRVCGRCGRVGAIALLEAADGTRDLCFACYNHEPRKVCGGCGQLAAIHVRGRDGQPDLCQRCYRPPVARCSVCDRDKPCYHLDTDAPVCWSCRPRRVAVCAVCGREQPVKARSPLGPLCNACEWRRLRAKGVCERCGRACRPALHPGGQTLCGDCAGVPQTRICASCGAEDVTYDRGLCPACSLRNRLDALRAAGPPAVIARLEAHLQTLEQTANPLTTRQWLAKPAGRLLARLASSEIELTHDALDALPAKSVDELRAALVHSGALPARDELLAKFERWIAERLAMIEPGADHTTLRQFATWKIQRELAARRRRSDRRADVLAATMPKNWIAAAIDLVAWLHGQGARLADLDQSRLEEWVSGGPAQRRHVARFIAWLERQHGARGLRVPPRPASVATIALPDRERLGALRRLLDDDTIEDHLRVAGWLVALYAQPAARIVRLTTSDLAVTDDAALVRLGEQVPLPAALRPPAARLLRRAGTRDPGWLFAGQKAGQPTHPAHLSRRLRRLGVPLVPARGSALATLAHRIPAPVLADLLGLHAHTVANHSATLKVDYANYIARRT
jgi:hypothetical protein